MPWITEAGLSLVERRRRVAVLHQTCSAIVAVAPQQRPSSLGAFANFTRSARKISTFTVAPSALLRHLDDVPAELANHPELQPSCVEPSLLEEPPAILPHHVRRQWGIQKESVAKGDFTTFVRWIKTVAAVARTYSAEEVAEALAELQLFSRSVNQEVADFGCDMSEARMFELLPREEHLPLRPACKQHALQVHDFVRTVPMPAGCAGAFLGKCGSASKRLTSQLQSVAAKVQVCSPPAVQLRLHSFGGHTKLGTVQLTMRWHRFERTRPQAKMAMHHIQALVSELHQIVAESVASIYRDRLTALFNRRADRAEIRWEACRAYHEARLLERRMKQASPNDSASRGLLLPPHGVSRQHQSGRKGMARQRWRAAMHQKRKDLLLACGELGLFKAPCARLVKQHAGQLDACRAANGLSNRPPPCGTGAAQRLMQQLSACNGETALEALDKFSACRVAADRPIRRPKHLRPKPSRQAKRAAAIGPTALGISPC